MAVERSSLEFFIKTTYDASGAKQANADLQQATTATKSAGDAAKKVVPDLDEHAKHTEKLGLKHLELKKVLNELSREFPIMGEAAKLALEPEVTIALSVVAAFAYLKNQYDETQEALRGGDWSTPVSQLGALDKAASDSAESLASYERSLESIATAQTRIQQETNTTIGRLAAEAAVTQKLADAQFDLAKAQLEREAASGKISPEEKEKRTENLTNKKLDNDANAKLKLLQNQLKALKDQRAEMEAKIESENLDEESAAIGVASISKLNERKKVIENRLKGNETRPGEYAALGVNENLNAVDKSGNALKINPDTGELSGEKTGELGRLDKLKEQMELLEKLKKIHLNQIQMQPVSDQEKDRQAKAFEQSDLSQQLKEAQDAFERQKRLVETGRKLITEDKTAVETDIPAAIKKAQETDQASKDLNKQLDDLVRNKIPDIEEQIKLLEKEITEVIPVQKQANSVGSQTRVNEIQAKRDREEQQEIERIERENSRRFNGSKPQANAAGEIDGQQFSQATDAAGNNIQQLAQTLVAGQADLAARIQQTRTWAAQQIAAINSRNKSNDVPA